MNKQFILFNYFKKYVDFKMGVYGALILGSLVFGINYLETTDFSGSAMASLKQAAYTFLFGGIIMRMCELIAINIKQKTIALISATLIPTLISVGLTFAMHSLKGTPKPLLSTIPTVFFVIPSTFIWGMMKRKKHFDKA